MSGDVSEAALCGTYWGSHGCALPAGHDEQAQAVVVHQCGPDDPEDWPCSYAKIVDGQTWVQYVFADGDASSWDQAGPLFRMDGMPIR